MTMRFSALLVVLVVLLSPVSDAAAQSMLETVRQRGYLQCGVSQGLPGFSYADDKGRWSGLDVDFCRAVAAAVLGDAAKLRFTPLSAKDRFTALQSGEVDILSRNTTWTLSRDAGLGIDFAGIIYYDGQGFMVPKRLGIDSARHLNGATICTNTGTTTELNLADYFRAQGMNYRLLAFEKSEEVAAAYAAGRCDVYTTDRSGLYAQRTRFADPEAHRILPEVISKEPLGPAVRHGDDQWLDIVRWTLFALIAAEEQGITAKNVATMANSPKPEVRRLLGVEGDLGRRLGLDSDWAARAIGQVGNYGEIFERNLGAGTPLGMERGLNNLRTAGGLMYAPPFR